MKRLNHICIGNSFIAQDTIELYAGVTLIYNGNTSFTCMDNIELLCVVNMGLYARGTYVYM